MASLWTVRSQEVIFEELGGDTWPRLVQNLLDRVQWLRQMAQEREAHSLFSLRRSLFFLFNLDLGLLLVDKLDLFYRAGGPFDRLFAAWFLLLWFDSDKFCWRSYLSLDLLGWQERLDEGDFPLLWRLSGMEKALTPVAIPSC